MPLPDFGRRAFTWIVVVALAGPLVADGGEPSDRDRDLSPEQIAAREARRAAANDDFERKGVVVGEPVPDLPVVTLDGRERRLAELWRERPTLIVTASLTCGRSRERQPWVEKLAQKYEDDLNVAVVYTLEAHPTIDPSPYAQYSPELENPERPGERPGGNEKVGLLRRQPTDLEGREKLAREFQELLEAQVPILLDEMHNEAWKTLGGGPNVGVLVGTDGIVKVKHGWFDGVTMERSIEHYLSQHRE